jgi:hypothetical protein
MNTGVLFISCILLMIVWLCLGLYWGYRYAIHHHKIMEVDDIRSYIKNNFATEWDAYQLGFKEGYELGGHDGRNPPL